MANKETNSFMVSKQTSFVYEDLVSQVKEIQHRLVEAFKYLNNRWKNEKKIQNELKSRSLTFIDPYGNPKTDRYMDHQLICQLFQQFKKNQIPKYLQQWIKIGQKRENLILPLNNNELKSSVSIYPDEHQFVLYGEVIVWIGNYEDLLPIRLVLPVFLNDNMEMIKLKLEQRYNITNIELKSFIINPYSEPCKKSWNAGQMLKSNDTIMSCQLYQQNSIIMAKLINQKEMDVTDYMPSFDIFVKTLTGQTLTIKVNSNMDVITMKNLIRARIGHPPDQQRLIYSGIQLEDEITLSDYKIADGSTIYLVLSLRGGMYHFTSGRQDFQNLPNQTAKMIKNVFEFKFEEMNHLERMSSNEIQNFIFAGQAILSDLFKEIQEFPRPTSVSNLKTILIATPDIDEYNDNDINSSFNDQ